MMIDRNSGVVQTYNTLRRHHKEFRRLISEKAPQEEPTQAPKDSVVRDALKNLLQDKNFHHAFHYPQYVSAAERKTQLVSRGLWDEQQMAPTELGKAVSAALHEYLRSDQLSDEEIRLYLRTHRQLLRAMREHCCCASEVDIAQLVSLGLIVKVLDGWNVVTLRTGKGWRVLRLM